jgi:hypothetical protein
MFNLVHCIDLAGEADEFRVMSSYFVARHISVPIFDTGKPPNAPRQLARTINPIVIEQA